MVRDRYAREARPLQRKLKKLFKSLADVLRSCSVVSFNSAASIFLDVGLPSVKNHGVHGGVRLLTVLLITKLMKNY